MKAFIDKYVDRIHGVLSCFDRMLLQGYLPIMSGWSMAQLLQAYEIDCASVKPFLLSNAERVKAHAQAMDRDLGLLHVRVQTWFPLQIQIYLNGHEWLERKLTARGIEHPRSTTSSSASATCRGRSVWPIASRT